VTISKCDSLISSSETRVNTEIRSERKKSTYLNELAGKPLVKSISQRSEELALHKLV
jgi:hypothetical protein